ncbi:hypothetical protein PHYPSEUDO_008687 [Phytophthora pseudosyringae]|uniref:Uncharacterized protein n=1 Tax=Phytophthora pseudosyringae TaxID=221518 RepID=A0A8T1VE43_9STRA|nr:hypothetical protein PHYPSEUDO_008687 [Phytophthora pseudosyringae]
MPHSETHAAPPAESRGPKRRRMSSGSKNAAKPSASRRKSKPTMHAPKPMSNSTYFLVTEDRVLFKEIWRALRCDGWTSKAPRGLDNSYRYVKPIGNPDGEDGIDYFRGEQDLVNYYQKQSNQLIQTDGGTVRVLPSKSPLQLSRIGSLVVTRRRDVKMQSPTMSSASKIVTETPHSAL